MQWIIILQTDNFSCSGYKKHFGDWNGILVLPVEFNTWTSKYFDSPNCSPDTNKAKRWIPTQSCWFVGKSML